jgi:2Fe-2S ferredoxin
VRIEPLGVEIEVKRGETLIEAAWRLGYLWPTVCYGQATCTLCHVEVIAGAEHLSPVEDEERDALEHRLANTPHRELALLRLACRTRPTGDATVRKEGVSAPGPPSHPTAERPSPRSR